MLKSKLRLATVYIKVAQDQTRVDLERVDTTTAPEVGMSRLIWTRLKLVPPGTNSVFGPPIWDICEVVQIFQWESIFCRRISYGGSLFIKKLVPGGNNFGGPFLP